MNSSLPRLPSSWRLPTPKERWEEHNLLPTGSALQPIRCSSWRGCYTFSHRPYSRYLSNGHAHPSCRKPHLTSSQSGWSQRTCHHPIGAPGRFRMSRTNRTVSIAISSGWHTRPPCTRSILTPLRPVYSRFLRKKSSAAQRRSTRKPSVVGEIICTMFGA
ncbi:hypothetical protein C8Q76DRAFT_699494 [Earliella scabrosa]|nr:hypothetical protein C8Q76DRAFT_699494 [Earliella scabrosa]